MDYLKKESILRKDNNSWGFIWEKGRGSSPNGQKQKGAGGANRNTEESARFSRAAPREYGAKT